MLFHQAIKYNLSTITIISGAPRFNKLASRIMETLKATSDNPIKFLGVVGNQDKEKLEKVYGSNKVLDHEEIVVNRNYKQDKIQSLLCPYRTNTYLRIYKFVKQMKSNNIIQDLQQQKVDAVITVGNYGLIKYFYNQVNDVYKNNNQLKPLMLGYDLMNAHRKLDNEIFLDYLYYNLPQSPQNLTKYIFPSTCIGYQSLFRAFQFLQKYRENPDNDSFLIKSFSYEVSQLVKAARSQYRVANDINQDHYLTIFAPGNTQHQINFSFKVFSKSLQQFATHSNIQGINSEFFKVLILLPEQQKIANLIKSKIDSLPKNHAIRVVESKDKYSAMCASDFAILHNGQITVEAAACQLPATVISSMSNYKAYLTYLYNGHDSPLNISTNYEGYQDLLGSLTAIPNKISSIMVDNFQRPKLRFYYVKLYRQEIQKMLAMNGKNLSLSVSKTGLQRSAQEIIQKINQYKKVKQSQSNYLSLNKRKKELQLI